MKQLRRILLILCLLMPSVGWFFQADQMPEALNEPMGRTFFYVFCLLAVLLSPFMMMFAIGFQIVNPFTDETWNIPTADCNPLRLGNPLRFGHFASQLCIAQGVGLLLVSLWAGWPHNLSRGIYLAVAGVTTGLVGFGFFLGLLWTIRLAGDKVQPSHTRPKLFDW